jgi:hypothetical protein
LDNMKRFLNRNGCMFVCTSIFQHNTHYRAVAGIPICVSVTPIAIDNMWGDPMEASHIISPQKIMLRIYILYT